MLGWGCQEEEPEELPFWAELPGLNAALAEQLLALHRKVPERCGAREVSQILGGWAGEEGRTRQGDGEG